MQEDTSRTLYKPQVYLVEPLFSVSTLMEVGGGHLIGIGVPLLFFYYL